MFEALGIDLVSLIWQIVAFVILIALLNRLLFKPIRKTLDERTRRIQESMEETERVKQQSMRADEEYQSRIQEAQQEAQEILGQARGQARQDQEGILERAREESQQFLRDARVQLELEQRDMARDARQQVAGLTVLAAGRLIGETLDPEKHQRLVEQQIEALDEPLQELGLALIHVAPEQVGVVQVHSATALSEETQEAIRVRVVGRLDREVDMAFHLEPDLLGGFVLQVGDQVIDLSVARKLNDLFRDLTA